jgi:hypothetical protein
MDETMMTIMTTKWQDSEYQKLWYMVFIQKVNGGTLEMKFHRVLAACKDFESNINLNKCMIMKIGLRTRDMVRMKHNVIRNMDSLK